MTATATITPAPSLPLPECPVAFLAALLPIAKAAHKAGRYSLARIFAHAVEATSPESPGWVEVWATDGHRLVTLRHCAGEASLVAAKAAAAQPARSDRQTGPTFAWSLEEATVAVATAKATKNAAMITPPSNGDGAPPMDKVIPVWATHVACAPSCPSSGLDYLTGWDDDAKAGMHPIPVGWGGDPAYVADAMRVVKDAGISRGKVRAVQSLGTFGSGDKCLSPAVWQSVGHGPGASTFVMLAVVMPMRL